MSSQIVRQIKDLIENETLKAGEALPSTRILAEKLGLNRSTVYEAYQELAALGYLESRPGAYTRIRKRYDVPARSSNPGSGRIAWAEAASPSSRGLFKEYLDYRKKDREQTSCKTINLSRLDLDDRVFPVDEFRKCMNRILAKNGLHLLQYGDVQGYRPLREFIARRSQTHGIEVSPEEILVTNGSQQALDLLFRFLTVPGRLVAIESPTYNYVLPLLKYHQTRALEIPMREDGLDLSFLEDTLNKECPAFLYTIPNFHNPTGISTSQAHRETLLSLGESHHLPIIEDGFEEEMKYFGKVTLPIKSMDKHNVVIYLGSFSKVLFPGLRLGWIAAERECIARLAAIKRFSDLSTNNVIQAAVHEFCRHGQYDLHIRRMHRIFRKRMQAALKTLTKNLPKEHVTWTEPAGGYLIWVQLQKPRGREKHFQEICGRHGVRVSPGRHFFHGPESGRYFRLSISTLDESEIMEGITALGRAIGEFYQ